VRARRGTIIGACVVGAYAALLVVVGVSAVVAGSDDDLAAGRFVSAYERSQLATYSMKGTYTRRSVSTDAEISSPVVEAQRPPERLRAQFGGVQGQIGDQLVVCGAVRGATTGKRCTWSRVAPYKDLVAQQVAVVRTYLSGDDPLYEVVQDGRCFDLRRTRYDPRPPYGEAARLCFDSETGALERIRVRNTGVVDETVATELRPTVVDADLVPPEPPPGS